MRRRRSAAWEGLVVGAVLAVAASGASLRGGEEVDLDRVLEILDAMPTPEEVLDRAAANAVAASAPTPPETGAADNAGETAAGGDADLPTIYLRDGGVLRGKVADPSIAVETPYGLLCIPFAALRDVHFALRSPPEVTEHVERAIGRLGAESFREREEATAELATVGVDAIPALRRARSSPDEEVRVRAERLLDELEAQLDEEEDGDPTMPLVQELDRVATLQFTIDARVSLDALTVECPYGTLTVPRREIVRLHFRRGGPQEAEVTVPSSATIPGSWLSTKIHVERGHKVSIAATGQMAVPDWGESCGPEGLGRISRNFAGLRMLSLVGRIGDSGQPFAVGPSFDERAPASGTLYLGIVPFQYTSTATGAFEVKVRVHE